MKHTADDHSKREASRELVEHVHYNAHADGVSKHLPVEAIDLLNALFGAASASKALFVTFLLLLEQSFTGEEKSRFHTTLKKISAEYKMLPAHFHEYLDQVYGESVGKGLFVLHVLHLARQLSPQQRDKLYNTYLNPNAEEPAMLDEFTLLKYFNDSLSGDPNSFLLFRP